jgi:ABC-type lipoprotein export system ATPase subunit
MQKFDLAVNTSNEVIQKLPLNNKDTNKGQSVSGTYKKKKVSDFVTIKNLDLQIKKGEFVCILGDVGSGKSSIIQLMIGDLLYMQRDFFKLFRHLDVNEYLQERIKHISKL